MQGNLYLDFDQWEGKVNFLKEISSHKSSSSMSPASTDEFMSEVEPDNWKGLNCLQIVHKLPVVFDRGDSILQMFQQSDL